MAVADRPPHCAHAWSVQGGIRPGRTGRRPPGRRFAKPPGMAYNGIHMCHPMEWLGGGVMELGDTTCHLWKFLTPWMR